MTMYQLTGSNFTSSRTSPTSPRSLEKRVVSSSTDKLSRYEIGDLLGEGAFGKVKLAQDVTTQRQVAVKLTLIADLQAQNLTQHMEQEIANLQQCSHRHVMRLYDVIYDPQTIYIVSEYCPEGDLYEFILEHGALSVRSCKQLFGQVVCGLEYIHSKHIIHRDLTLENILLDCEYNVKLADFGLSKQVRPGQYLTTGCGSPNYYAPEMLTESTYLGKPVDMWASGVVLFALLTGYMPFEDPDNDELYQLILKHELDYPQSLEEPERTAIEQLLVQNWEHRKTAREFTEDVWLKPPKPKVSSPTASRRIADKPKPHDMAMSTSFRGMRIMQQDKKTTKDAITHSSPSIEEDTSYSPSDEEEEDTPEEEEEDILEEEEENQPEENVSDTIAPVQQQQQSSYKVNAPQQQSYKATSSPQSTSYKVKSPQRPYNGPQQSGKTSTPRVHHHHQSSYRKVNSPGQNSPYNGSPYRVQSPMQAPLHSNTNIVHDGRRSSVPPSPTMQQQTFAKVRQQQSNGSSTGVRPPPPPTYHKQPTVQSPPSQRPPRTPPLPPHSPWQQQIYKSPKSSNKTKVPPNMQEIYKSPSHNKVPTMRPSSSTKTTTSPSTGSSRVPTMKPSTAKTFVASVSPNNNSNNKTSTIKKPSQLFSNKQRNKQKKTKSSPTQQQQRFSFLGRRDRFQRLEDDYGEF